VVPLPSGSSLIVFIFVVLPTVLRAQLPLRILMFSIDNLKAREHSEDLDVDMKILAGISNK
jgi:hypothetical protein